MKFLLTILSFIYSFSSVAQLNDVPLQLNGPHALVVDSKDNLFVLMKYGIAKITPAGTIIDLRKLPGNSALDRNFSNLIIDSKNTLYASDGNIIYQITVSDNNQATFKQYAGEIGRYRIVDGSISSAIFVHIGKMAIDKNDNIYLTDSYDKIAEEIGTNYVTDNYYKKNPKYKYFKVFSIIRKISASGMVSTLKSSDGKYVTPNNVVGLTCDLDGNLIYATNGVRTIEKINVATGSFIHIAGKAYKREFCPVYIPGDTSKAELFTPETVIVNKKNEIIFVDERNFRIIKVANGKVTTIAGNNIIDPCQQNIGGRAQEGHKDGKALTALFNFPKGIGYDSKGNLFIADKVSNCIRKLSPDGMVSSFTNFDRSKANISIYRKDDNGTN